jgi:hypothetical protein
MSTSDQKNDVAVEQPKWNKLALTSFIIAIAYVIYVLALIVLGKDIADIVPLPFSVSLGNGINWQPILGIISFVILLLNIVFAHYSLRKFRRGLKGRRYGAIALALGYLSLIFVVFTFVTLI